jgi:hypothetical protein
VRLFSIFLVLLFFSVSISGAMDTSLLDIDLSDLDSIFGNPGAEPSQPAQETTSVIQDIRRRSIEFNASYMFRAAINPGWEEYPWSLDGSEHFSWAIGIMMKSTFGINAQISEFFRIRSDFIMDIPSDSASLFTLGDFFFDYNFYDKVFLRAGKFEQSWGISPNFGFTNLLSRIAIQQASPAPSSDGPSYIAKADIPIGIGGLQLLCLTRVNIASGETPTRDFIGIGGKYNLAFRWADFNMGLFAQNFMATRGFLSIKTTLFNTDFYNEWLVSMNNHTDNSFKLAFNFGFTKNLFNNRIEVNGEFFHNGEESTLFFQPETEFRRIDTPPFLEGINMALNILCRLDGSLNFRFFTRVLYASMDRDGNETIFEPSFSIVPGFRITPMPNIEVYFAVPIALGKGFYYRTTKDVTQKYQRPLSMVLYVTFRGNAQVRHTY